jgi:ABC-2 type transport system ATP-binding protein
MSPTSSAEPAGGRPPASAAPKRFGAPIRVERGETTPPEELGPASPAIVTLGLHKRFSKTVAVKSLSMSVGRGEIFGFLGPNGAGKTTVVKMLLGLVRPSGGEALVLGAPIGDRETRRRIGYLPELFRFQPWLSAREVLHLHCRLLQLPNSSWAAAASQSLSTVGLKARADDKVGGFSKGMQQRLGLGVALLGDPDLVILDEPTSALDPIGRHDVRQITRELRERGATVFLNTHLLEEAEQVCDRVAVIDKGTAVATGSLTELLGRQARVRLKVTALPSGWWHHLARFGSWTAQGEWVTVEGIQTGNVPDLIEEIVRTGGRIEAVVPEHQSLEDRFLELLRGE